MTPAHHYGDFRFKTYAPIAFRYFREMFGIRPDDYMVFLFAQHSLKCAKKKRKTLKFCGMGFDCELRVTNEMEQVKLGK